jgi:uncharacterized membrane protein
MAFCSSCGAQIPAGATACPACAHSAAPAATGTTQAAGGGLTDNVAGMLAYITFIPAVLFLVMEPYNRNRFIRFHSFQSIFLFVAAVILSVAIGMLAIMLLFIPFLGHLVILLLRMTFSLGLFIVWIVLLIKANQGLMYKLPIIGDIAEKQANS